MSILVKILPYISIFCFLSAIVFFRKEKEDISEAVLPFMMSTLTPNKLASYLKKEGIVLIAISMLCLFIYAFF